ncbi:hypothetical protein HN51_021677 [Arachis hypogaea]
MRPRPTKVSLDYLIEKPRADQGRKGTASSKASEDGATRDASGLDKKGQADTSENVTSSDDRVLYSDHGGEDLERSDKVATRGSTGHAKIIELLLQSIPTEGKEKPHLVVNSSGDSGTKTVRGRKAPAVAQKKVLLGSTTKIPRQAVPNPVRNIPSLKRKLEFTDNNGSDGLDDVHQNGPGKPFTYYTHVGHYMDDGEIPQVKDPKNHVY